MVKANPIPLEVEMEMGARLRWERSGDWIWIAGMTATPAGKFAESSTAVLLAAMGFLARAITGPVLHFSAAWQLVNNMATAIVTFLMLFIHQQVHKNDFIANQAIPNKSNAAEQSAGDRLLTGEMLPQIKREVLRGFYFHLSNSTKKRNDLYKLHLVNASKDAHQSICSLQQRGDVEQSK